MLPTPKRHMGTLCDALVEGRHVSYHCTLERGHEANDEPHYAVEVPKSVRAWQDWHEARSGVLRAQKSPAEQLGSVHTRPPEPAPEPDAPKCGNRLTPILGGEDLLCVRPAGHEAEHTNGFTIWTEVPEEPRDTALSDEQAAANERVLTATAQCTGDSLCKAGLHWHGCFADAEGNCTEPGEHLVKEVLGWPRCQSTEERAGKVSQCGRPDGHDGVHAYQITSEPTKTFDDKPNPTDASGRPMTPHVYQWTGRSPNTCAVTIGDQWCGQGEEDEVHQSPLAMQPSRRLRTESEKHQILSEMRPSLSEEGHVMKRLPSSGRCFATLRSPSTSATVLWCEKDWEHEGEHRAGDRTWTVPTKTRVGDQRLPDGTGVCVQDVIIAEMEESKRVGVERYGQTLRTFNGRKGIVDVAEELRDAFVYMTQIKTEAQATRNTLVEAVKQALDAEDPMDDVGDRYRAAFAEIAVDRIMGWVVGNTMTGEAPDAQ